MVYAFVITAARSDNPEAVLSGECVVPERVVAQFCAENAVLARGITELDAAVAEAKKTAQAEASPEPVQ